jgi:hypothetical protein
VRVTALLRLAVVLLAATAPVALGGCLAPPDDGPSPLDCPAGQLRVCRTATDCVCAAPCTPPASCPDGARGPSVCAELTDATSPGACVEIAWLTGRPDGRLPCGTTTCDPSALCVDFARDGVQCAASCMVNADCGSGCCIEVGARDGSYSRRVCAPNANYRCESTSAAGVTCATPCGPSAVCFTVQGAARCLPRCTVDADCPQSCCLPTAERVSVCAPDPARCPGRDVTGMRAACSNLDACVTVTGATRGDYCASQDSVEVRVRNDCTRPVDVEICYEARDGRCVCGLHSNLAPGAAPAAPFWACGLTGRYALSARGAGDAPGCHPTRCN